MSRRSFELAIEECMSEKQGFGICTHMNDHLNDRVYTLCKTFMVEYLIDRGWYSGCNVYPIYPYDHKITHPLEAIRIARNVYDKLNNWHPNSVYGKRRIALYEALLQFMDEKGIQ